MPLSDCVVAGPGRLLRGLDAVAHPAVITSTTPSLPSGGDLCEARSSPPPVIHEDLTVLHVNIR
eukprot:8744367-Alexandrium_andersonii.AAC.1